MSVRKSVMLGAAMAVLVSLAGCGTTRVERIAPDQVRDLSGRWNDTDSRLVSEQMVSEMLSRAWLGRYNRTHRDPPTVIVGEIRNLSHEHIAVDTFVNDIERQLINAGSVTFVASATERQGVREERADQDLNASESTRNPMGQEQGADFMLSGSINTIVDASGREQVTYYQVDLTLISMADNRKVWIGQKKIKKLIEHPVFRP
ncbi:MAG: penicillin-binding protein activator LpoB [Gammaproteobacteria bacterium]|jgi:hypothetical protein